MSTTYLTTGQIAMICKVAPRTVSKWIDDGVLRGERLPGRSRRRVLKRNLLAFMQVNGIPTGDLIETVVVVTDNGTLTESLQQRLPEWKVVHAGSAVEAGIAVQAHHASWLLVDFKAAHEVLAGLHGLPRQRSYRLAVIMKDPVEGTADRAGVDLVLSWPVNIDALAGELEKPRSSRVRRAA